MITILYSLRIVRSDGCKCITGMGENRKSGSENPVERRAANCLRKSLATNFFGPFPQEIARHKLFRLISSGNRPPQNFFGSFPQEIGRHKLFRLISSGNRWDGLPLISSGNRPPQNFFSQLPEEIARKRSLPRPGKFAGYGMYPKRDGENFVGGRSPSFLLLIEEKKQKKIKAPGVPAIFGRVRDG